MLANARNAPNAPECFYFTYGMYSYSNAPECIKMLPNASKLSQVFPNYMETLEIIWEHLKCCQILPRACKSFPMHPYAILYFTRWIYSYANAPECARMLPKAGTVNGSQMHPNAPDKCFQSISNASKCYHTLANASKCS